MTRQNLAADFTRRAERLLTFWANSPDETWSDGPVRYGYAHGRSALRAAQPTRRDLLIRQFPEVFASPLTAKNPTGARFFTHVMIGNVRSQLRAAWDAPNLREREWQIFIMRQTYQRWQQNTAPPGGDVPSLMSAPPLTPFEQVMYYFQRIARRAHHCENSTCPAPYFLARKKGQRYCSAACAEPAQREAKLRWWNEKGKVIRAKKSKKQEKKK